MKRIKRLLYLLILLFVPIIANASDYEVKNYNIDVIVNEEREYEYKEIIDVYFKKNNTLILKEFNKDVKNIKVDADFTIETRDNKVIKINNKNNIEDTYTYTYLDKVEYDNKDIYEIVIDNNFNSDLNNIKFNITFPEDFNKNNLDFYINDKKIKDIQYEIKDNKLIGKINNLKEDEYLTIKVDYGKLYVNTTTIIGITIPVILALISFLIWHIYGKDLKYNIERTPNIERKLSILDVSLIYNGVSTEKDVFYLLLHLANKGYIKIIENSNNNFTLKKGIEYNGKDYKEATFLKTLFRKETTVSLTEYINIVAERKTNKSNIMDKQIDNKDLNRRFQRTVKNILPLINNEEEQKKYFDKTSENKKYYLLMIIAAILILVTSLPFIEMNKLYFLPISVVLSIFILGLLTTSLKNIDIKNKKDTMIYFTILIITMLVLFLYPSFRRNRMYILVFLAGIICVSFVLFLYKYMPKRSVYGSKRLGRIEGLKEFLIKLKQEELDNVLSINPNYLYDILPYSYIIGCEEIVIKKLKEKEIKKPNWYTLSSDYTPQKFSNSIKRLYENLKEKKED